MKFKTRLLTFLLLLLLTLAGYAQMPPELQNGQNNAYGIRPEQSYPGTLVLELMETAEAELETAVTEAYAEGYKAAMLQYAPELAALRIREQVLQTELERERQKLPGWVKLSIGFAGGFLTHFFMSR
jgi:hypothetical protein